jgi:DNA topoisomerase-1
MELIIAEKPSAAEKIAYALGPAIRKRFGRVSYFEITNTNKDKMIVVPAVGHLFTLKEKTVATPAFDIEWLPTFKVNKHAYYMKSYLDAIQYLAKGADKFTIATDYDLEGDLIGANIAKNIGIFERAKRMKFSTLTAVELRQAHENLEDVNVFNVLASETRHIIDWIYGINLSRAVMSALKKAGRSKILSMGRVQGPMLRFLAERQHEIESFIPRRFWELFALAQNTRFQHKTKQFFDKSEVEKARDETPKEGKFQVRVEQSIRPPFPPFDFTSLQTEAYRIFGYTPIYTESLAQALYSNALISYPRTSSQKLPPQLNLPSIINKLAENPKYGALASKLITDKRFKPRQGAKEDVHPAIFPTGLKGKMSADEERLYDLIVRRFLACFAESAEIEEKTVELIAGQHAYVANGRRISKEGWFAYYKFNTPTEILLPDFKNDAIVKIDNFEILEKETSPPFRYTPASILRFMEEQELGTKTTRAIILDTLYKRGYVTGRQINVTPLGRAIYDIFNKYSPKVVDPELTRKLENEMECIQKEQITQQQVITNAKEIVTGILDDLKNSENEIGNELLEKVKETETFATCKCGGTLRVLQKGGSKFLGCTNYPTCKITYSLPKTLFSYAGQCEACGAPKIWIIMKRQRFIACVNRECPEKIAKLQKAEKAREEKAKEKAKKEEEKVKEKARKEEERARLKKEKEKAKKEAKAAAKKTKKKAKTKKRTKKEMKALKD